MALRIDAHHHLWRYNAAEYDWISPEMAPLRRDFLPADLQETLRSAAIDGAISVQARQCLDETRWLLDLARQTPAICAVVGWAPLTDPALAEILAEFTPDPKFRALRHVLQGEPDMAYMLREAFVGGLKTLAPLGLSYDLLILERQLPQAIELVDKLPGQIFILDHLAKPRIAAGEIDSWQKSMRELARRPHVYCKLSGMVTEADWISWTPGALLPYFRVALEAFGPRRLMFGSDWPVCLAACDYPRWVKLVEQWIAELSRSEQDRILGLTALEAYGLA